MKKPLAYGGDPVSGAVGFSAPDGVARRVTGQAVGATMPYSWILR